MGKLTPFPIRKFSGIETEVSGLDQERGTLRQADGVNVTPLGALSFGPKWATAWGRTTLGADIVTALSGATSSRVHFVTLTRNGYTFLIAYNVTSNRPQGIWQVAGTDDPVLTAGSGSSITATNTSVYRDKTNLLRWYGSWIDDQLWLGNGTDANLVWASGALAFLGPSGTPDAMDLSQVVFPPCKSFVKAKDGSRYGAGNVSTPLRIWKSARPNIDYPKPQGLRALTYSYKDIQPGNGATAITALSIVGETIICHLDVGTPLILTVSESQGGWKFDQRPMESNASAINPNCTRDTKIAPFYLGSDLEVYAPKQRQAYNKSDWRETDIATNRSSGEWNNAATKPVGGDADYAVVYDEKNGRFWFWAKMSAGSRRGVYCYDQRLQGITGPWRYPDFLSVCQLTDENLNGCLVAGITRDGAFLWSDMANIGDVDQIAFGTALGAAYEIVLVAPTPDAGIPYVGFNSTTGAVKMVLNGQTLSMADPWSPWAVGDVSAPNFLNNARVSVVEFSEEDCGSPDIVKEFCQCITEWRRNSRVYVGVFCEVAGNRFGAWLTSALYPTPSWVHSLGGQGATIKLRLVIISFNDSPALLTSVTPTFIPSALP